MNRLTTEEYLEIFTYSVFALYMYHLMVAVINVYI